MPNPSTPVIHAVTGTKTGAAVPAVSPPVVVTPGGGQTPVVIQPAPPQGPPGPQGEPGADGVDGVGVVVSATEPINPALGTIWVTP